MAARTGCGRCPQLADSVEKVPNTLTAKISLSWTGHLHLTLVSLIIRFGATYVASALGRATLRVLVRKTLPQRGKNLVERVEGLFQQNRPLADIFAATRRLIRSVVVVAALSGSTAGPDNHAGSGQRVLRRSAPHRAAKTAAGSRR